MVKGQMMVHSAPFEKTSASLTGFGKTDSDLARFLGLLGISNKEMHALRLANPLVLAFVGDAVYEHYVRMAVIHRTKGGIHQLHKQSTRYVRATAQAYVVKNLENFLTEEERDMIRRGRNQKGHSAPKNTLAVDYRLATGFETLIGYLSLSNNPKRLEEVIAKAMDIVDLCALDSAASSPEHQGSATPVRSEEL